MICLKCFHKKTRVINSRQNKKHPTTWRRRQCERCSYSFTTYEKPAESFPIHSQGGDKSDFSIGKLTISISKSFQHNKNVADFYSYELACTVQEKLLIINSQRPVLTKDISQITHSTLQKFDQIAAIQYAAQHKLIAASQKTKRGRPSFYYSQHDHGHSSQQ